MKDYKGSKQRQGQKGPQRPKGMKHGNNLNSHQQQVMENQKKKKALLTKVRYNDVDRLKERIKKETPSPGECMYDYKLEKSEEEQQKMSPEEFRRKYKMNFADLPISNNTIVGLQKRKFIKMTEIQRCAIPHIIAGRDILAASKTGSGKTLAYLIPLVERLYVQKWNPLDGLGAIVILPTRELVFEVFNSFTVNHDLSVGLIIGGKSVKYEKDNMKGMNILICTPGRLLQHMDETPDFDCSNLQMLVIDEADLLLELGFQETLNAILFNLPPQRQTILFSATLSKTIHQLSKLSLKNPEYIFLHEARQSSSELMPTNSPATGLKVE